MFSFKESILEESQMDFWSFKFLLAFSSCHSQPCQASVFFTSWWNHGCSWDFLKQHTCHLLPFSLDQTHSLTQHRLCRHLSVSRAKGICYDLLLRRKPILSQNSIKFEFSGERCDVKIIRHALSSYNKCFPCCKFKMFFPGPLQFPPFRE